MEAEARDRSLAELLRDLSNETATLVRQEMDLARAELAEKVKPVRASAVSFGATALFGLGAFGAATAFLIALLALLVPLWASALIITAVYGGAAALLAQNGQKKLQEAAPLAVPQTAQTVKDDIAWAKTQIKSGTK